MSGMWIQCAPRSYGTPKMLVLVRQRPPTTSLASIRAKRRLAAMTRRAAATPAAPAPMMATSTSPEAGAAPSAGRATAAAVPARNKRRLMLMGLVRALFRRNLPEGDSLRKSGGLARDFHDTGAIS